MTDQPVAIDEQLAGVWRHVLRVPAVQAGDDFFDLGGTSLQAVQIVTRVRDLFSIELPVAVLERAPTLGEFTTVVSTVVRTTADERRDQAIHEQP